MIFLALPELLRIAARTLGPDYDVRDYGLLEAAPARPQDTASGKDAYPTLDTKGAALLHSLARNHVLIGGNERLAPAAPPDGSTRSMTSPPSSMAQQNPGTEADSQASLFQFKGHICMCGHSPKCKR